MKHLSFGRAVPRAFVAVLLLVGLFALTAAVSASATAGKVCLWHQEGGSPGKYISVSEQGAANHLKQHPLDHLAPGKCGAEPTSTPPTPPPDGTSTPTPGGHQNTGPDDIGYAVVGLASLLSMGGLGFGIRTLTRRV